MKAIISLFALGGLALMTLLLMRQVCDLAVEDIQLNPRHPRKGDGVTVSYRVVNRGPCVLPRKSYRVSMMIGDKKLQCDTSGSPLPLGFDQGVTYSQMKGFSTFTMNNHKEIVIMVMPKILHAIDPDLSNNRVVVKIEE
jgi:hypothetical protein